MFYVNALAPEGLPFQPKRLPYASIAVDQESQKRNLSAYGQQGRCGERPDDLRNGAIYGNGLI
jgi:hypothetical protein